MSCIRSADPAENRTEGIKLKNPFVKKHSLKVSLSETRSRGSVKRTAKFDDKEIWWDISGDESILPPRLTVRDIAATGLVFFAMHHGKHLHVEGPVSASLLENLEDLVVSWVNRRPDLYQRINISAAKEVRTLDEPSSPVIGNQAVAAFSGGLDASFTAWRHVSGKVGRRNKKIDCGCPDPWFRYTNRRTSGI